MENEEINVIDALLDPLECANCHSQKCTVEPILPQFTETQEMGLFINCAECGEHIANLALTEECADMMLRAEKETIADELADKSN